MRYRHRSADTRSEAEAGEAAVNHRDDVRARGLMSTELYEHVKRILKAKQPPNVNPQPHKHHVNAFRLNAA